MPQLDSSVYTMGLYSYSFFFIVLFFILLTGELIVLKHIAFLRAIFAFKKINILNPTIYKKCY